MVSPSDGPTHAYMGASPGCWALFGEVLAKEYGDPSFMAVHRLTVDAYAVQHTGRPERRAIQSVAVHLIGLYMTLERGFDASQATQAIKNAANRSSSFTWLAPPASLGTTTILDVHRVGDDAHRHRIVVAQWTRAAWAAWEPHHAQIRLWASP